MLMMGRVRRRASDECKIRKRGHMTCWVGGGKHTTQWNGSIFHSPFHLGATVLFRPNHMAMEHGSANVVGEKSKQTRHSCGGRRHRAFTMLSSWCSLFPCPSQLVGFQTRSRWHYEIGMAHRYCQRGCVCQLAWLWEGLFDIMNRAAKFHEQRGRRLLIGTEES
jgi:hypothetical protein